MHIRRIHSQSEGDIEKFMKIRKESIAEDEGVHNLMTYPDEEANFSVEGYKKYDFLKHYIIAEKNGEFIAYGAFHINWPRNFQWNHNVTIWPLYVSRAFRRRKIGEKILENIENEIMQNFSHKNINLLLLVNSENVSAISFYKKCGFDEMWYYKNYIQTKEGRYFDVKIMQKILSHKKEGK